MSKSHPKYSSEVKKKAVEEFISGSKTAPQIADELGFKDSNHIYASFGDGWSFCLPYKG